MVVVAEALHADGHALIDYADDLAEALAVGGYRLLVSFAGGEVALPKATASLRRLGNLALDEAVQAVHHAVGEVVLRGERGGPRERRRLCGEAGKYRAGQQDEQQLANRYHGRLLSTGGYCRLCVG